MKHGGKLDFIFIRSKAIYLDRILQKTVLNALRQSRNIHITLSVTQESIVVSFLKFPKKLRSMFLVFPSVSKKQFHTVRLILPQGKTRGNKGINTDVAGQFTCLF